ncbi:hypothetical protein AUQ37_05380 [Candidatus Methanomethylophilus sp. 1R26]|uniref:hypothetical protein n=1 Tax=Candidatus Methanomethylophilus sp. 1R26 TaxID=1769296 RepID=UPI0007367C99|nr:hypothetical protein [Candidatus Methanomethylophilus sp. 1R26]KUE74223.1 hypothetical protein AUQ37_05380 [Candidatus Methanomethylophilus sp. 1R26]
MTSDNIESVNDLEKMKLWQRTLYLFGKYQNFEGPFYKAGYSEYKICQRIMRKKEIYCAPDIIAHTDDKKWLVMELTTDPNADKISQVKKYENITSDDVGHLAMNVDGKQSIIVSSYHELDVTCAQIVVSDNLLTKNTDSITDRKLAENLDSAKGIDLTKTPSSSFLILPESSQFEIRTSLLVSIQQMLMEKGSHKSVESLIEEGLDFISGSVSAVEKKSLASNVRIALKDLGKELREYVSFENDILTVNKNTSNALESIMKKLKTWQHNTKNSKQTTLQVD